MNKRPKIILIAIIFFIVALVVTAGYLSNKASKNFEFTNDYVSVLQHYEQREKEILTIDRGSEDSDIKQLLVEYSAQVDLDIYTIEKWKDHTGLIGAVAGQIVVGLESAKKGFDDIEELGGNNNAARKALFESSLKLVDDDANYRLLLLPGQRSKLVERLNYTFSKEAIDQYRENTEEVLPLHILAARTLIIALE